MNEHNVGGWMERGGNLSQLEKMIWGDLGGEGEGQRNRAFCAPTVCTTRSFSRFTRPGSPVIQSVGRLPVSAHQ